MAGALPNPVYGAILVFRGPTAEAAEEFAKADPYGHTRTCPKVTCARMDHCYW